ncbi:MAG: hypothetical protein NTX64_04565 [Elusimicrobia bacterium]|nr:hypothetical protein [Elusimicrobiota bacterium]
MRVRQIKNMLATLMLSQGVPMLVAGDECRRTQRGNNNAYCQDNELTWFDWELARKNADFTEFVRKAIALTRTYPVLQMRQFMVGKGESAGAGEPEIVWYGPDLDSPHWGDPEARLLCYQLATPLFFIWNTGHLPAQVRLPELRAHRRWRRIVDTGLPAGEDFAESGREVELKEQGRYQTGPRTTVILVGR